MFGDEMRLYCEIAGDSRDRTPEPWTYAPTLNDIREAARRALAEPLRSHYLALNAAETDAEMARRHERAAERRNELARAGWTT